MMGMLAQSLNNFYSGSLWSISPVTRVPTSVTAAPSLRGPGSHICTGSSPHSPLPLVQWAKDLAQILCARMLDDNQKKSPPLCGLTSYVQTLDYGSQWVGSHVVLLFVWKLLGVTEVQMTIPPLLPPPLWGFSSYHQLRVSLLHCFLRHFHIWPVPKSTPRSPFRRHLQSPQLLGMLVLKVHTWPTRSIFFSAMLLDLGHFLGYWHTWCSNFKIHSIGLML